MRVAFIHQPWDFARPNAFEGSLPLWIHEVTQRIRDRAEIIIYGKINPDRPPIEREDGIEYRGIDQRGDRKYLRLLRMLPRRHPLRPAFASPLYHRAYVAAIARDLRERNVDIVQIYNFTNFAPPIRRLNPRAKIVMHMQCEWINQLDRRMIAGRLRCVDGVIGCSEFVARRARQAFPDWPGLCECVPNGAHIQRFAPPAHLTQPPSAHVAQPPPAHVAQPPPAHVAQPPSAVPRPAALRAAAPAAEQARSTPTDRPVQILFVGRISPEKGLHTLLDAFELLRARGVPCELNILGPFGVAPYEYIAQIADPDQRAVLQPLYRTDYAADLQRRVARFNGAVRFLPKRPNTELPATYHAADIVVNPSISEAFGMTVVEAMASGRPVIGTRVGGMTELIGDESAGLLVPPNDPAGLAGAIARLAQDAPTRARMGGAGLRAAQAYSWDRVAERLLDFYDRLARVRSGAMACAAR